MDSTIFDEMLAESLGDPDGAIYTAGNRKYAANRALREYSRYRPYQRRIGTGHVFLTAPAAQTYANVIGGPFVAGDSVLVDPYTSASETKTVLSFAAESETARQAVATSKLTLTAGLTNQHESGAMVAKVTAGLVLQASQQMYYMPPDFIRVHEDSFAITTGRKAPGNRRASYYDGAYDASLAFDGSGVSGSIGYGPVSPGAYPYPAGAPIPGVTAGNLRFQWIPGNVVILRVINPPLVAVTLDFDYYGSHVFETLPDSDSEPIINYARYVALSAKASAIASKPDYQEGDVRRWGSRSATALRLEANEARDDFDIKIRRAPFMTAG